MKYVYQFDNSFCDRLVSIVDKNQCYSAEICRAENPDVEHLEPTNALEFEINPMRDESIIIDNVIKNIVNFVSSTKSVIQILDNTKKYIPYKYKNPYVFMVVLNDTFEGGRVSIDNILVSLKKGEVICIYPNESFNVEPVIAGERYCLVVLVDVENKKDKSIL
jgi:hypothetical protein